MPLTLTRVRKVENFAERKIWRCLHCGIRLENPTDLYSRRFCSVACKDAYFSPIKTV